MILLILGAIIGCVKGIINAYKATYSRLPDYIFYGLFGGVFGGLIGSCPALLVPAKTYNIEKVYKLENLSDGSNINGSLFLATGYINERMKYIFYYEKEGLFHLKELDHTEAVIKYSDSAKIIEVTKRPTKYWRNWFSLRWLQVRPNYIIEVPKGSIKSNYNLDAQ